MVLNNFQFVVYDFINDKEIKDCVITATGSIIDQYGAFVAAPPYNKYGFVVKPINWSMIKENDYTGLEDLRECCLKLFKGEK